MLRAGSFAQFTLSGNARFFAALRMTANGLRMTALENLPQSFQPCRSKTFRIIPSLRPPQVPAFLCGDPPVHIRLQHIQGQRAIAEQGIVKGAQVKALTE
jgi:hypothetical protein